MRTAIIAGLLCTLSSIPSSVAVAERPAAAPEHRLIARQDLFGNPTRNNPQISPDGRHIAFLAPRDGVMNVWVAPVGQLDAAKPVTNDTNRGIRNYRWARTSTHVLYIQDVGGDENWRVYLTDVATASTKALSPEGKVQARIEADSVTHPNAILIGLNDRDPQFHDIYRVDLTSGERSLVQRNEGYGGFVADDALRVRFAFRQTPAGGMDVFRVAEGGRIDTTPFVQIPAEDGLTSAPLGFDTEGATFYMLDSRGRDKAALATLDLETGKTSIIAESPRADVQQILAHPKTGRVQAIGATYLRQEWSAVDPAIQPDLELLNREARGEWRVLSRSDDDRLWTVLIDRTVEPVAFWLYDRAAKTLSRLFTSRPNLEGAPLSPMYPVEIKARDGLTLPSYVTLPRGSDADGDGRPEKPLPMVLNVHGGPWARDSYGYHGEHQWLANRGYAVLAVNYRGSSGFGKAFIERATHEFAGKMHDDLVDAVEWAIQSGIAQKDRVAIYGGSYGGYATLVGLTFTPDRFTCGVDIVGPSSLVTLIESFPPYWQPFLELTWYRRVGDPRTPEGRKMLLERSPITRVHEIKRPLLIAQGANDPRVTQKESDQIVAAMKGRGIPVTYAVYADEGHGFARPENRISFYALADLFLAGCLGGRAEPLRNDLAGAALKVPEGAAAIPGLTEALAKHATTR
jgi:dipeptidyl aminopeptidase/acylaminoacyl peptidase